MKKASTFLNVTVLVAGVLTGFCRADLGEGLVGYYGFNGNANDLSGNGNHGTIHGGATFTVDHWGNTDGALHLDGVNDYVQLSAEGSFDLIQFSIVITARVPNYSQENWLITKGLHYGNYTIYIFDDEVSSLAGAPLYVHGGIGNPSIGFGRYLPSNEYFQVAATFGSDGGKTYVNGDPTNQWPGMVDHPPPQNDDPVTIGAGGFYSLSEFYLGDIDEVRIYDRVLSATEVSALYTQVNPVPLPGAVLLGALGLSVAGWRLGRRTV